MSEKHVLVCDNCGKDIAPINDGVIRGAAAPLPEGALRILGSPAAEPWDFCSRKCARDHLDAWLDADDVRPGAQAAV